MNNKLINRRYLTNDARMVFAELQRASPQCPSQLCVELRMSTKKVDKALGELWVSCFAESVEHPEKFHQVLPARQLEERWRIKYHGINTRIKREKTGEITSIKRAELSLG